MGLAQGAVMGVLSELVAGAGGGLILLAVQSGWSLWRKKRDGALIYEWMVQEAAKPGADKFHSTRDIASYVNMTQERVYSLCSAHPKILLATGKAEDMWSITDRKRKGTFG
jgi:uncharacterized iron-regulated membrane protein